jgi:siroheme synthase (precorrin-2 oxidase/ferrochelatase)
MANASTELSGLKRVLLLGGNVHFAKRLAELVNAGAAVTIICSLNALTPSALEAILKNMPTRQIDYIDRNIIIDYDIRASLSYNLVVICMTSNSQARCVSHF